MTLKSNHIVTPRVGHSHAKGKAAETLAASFFVKNHWKLLALNRRIASVEVDALLSSPMGDLFIVECKSFSDKVESFHRLSKRQLSRLNRAAKALESRHPFSAVSILIALVNLDRKTVQVYDSGGEVFKV